MQWMVVEAVVRGFWLVLASRPLAERGAICLGQVESLPETAVLLLELGYAFL
jgi:hypothetical protein